MAAGHPAMIWMPDSLRVVGREPGGRDIAVRHQDLRVRAGLPAVSGIDGSDRQVTQDHETGAISSLLKKTAVRPIEPEVGPCPSKAVWETPEVSSHRTDPLSGEFPHLQHLQPDPLASLPHGLRIPPPLDQADSPVVHQALRRSNG